MKITDREAILGVVAMAALLFGGTAIVAKPRIEQWKTFRAKQAAMRSDIAADRKLIDGGPEWQARYAEISRKLVSVPADKRTDAYWLSIVDRTAAAHSLAISKRQAMEEKSLGDIQELPIECNWDGSLGSLVHFLFDLQSQGAMFDMRQLLVRPTASDMLRGRFVLYCAYTREKPVSAQR